MTDEPLFPPSVVPCASMAEVRAHIDALDARIVPLLAQRCAYVAQAGRIKPSAELIVDRPRIEAIIERVRLQAQSLGAPPQVVEAAYRALIDASIAYEREVFARHHRPAAPAPEAGQGGVA